MLSAASLAPKPAADRERDWHESERAREALEGLLALSVRILDRQPGALLELDEALVSLRARLRAAHVQQRRRAWDGSSALAVLWAAHAVRRARDDLRELRHLSQQIARSKDARTVGRLVAVSALTLLSHMSADERWYSAVQLLS